jgi:hypothetical protein
MQEYSRKQIPVLPLTPPIRQPSSAGSDGISNLAAQKETLSVAQARIKAEEVHRQEQGKVEQDACECSPEGVQRSLAVVV